MDASKSQITYNTSCDYLYSFKKLHLFLDSMIQAEIHSVLEHDSSHLWN